MYRPETACTKSTMRPSTVPMTRGGEGDDLKVMHLSDYLFETRLLYEFQSGFWSSHSTHTCLIHLTYYIKPENDKGRPNHRYILSRFPSHS